MKHRAITNFEQAVTAFIDCELDAGRNRSAIYQKLAPLYIRKGKLIEAARAINYIVPSLPWGTIKKERLETVKSVQAAASEIFYRGGFRNLEIAEKTLDALASLAKLADLPKKTINEISEDLEHYSSDLLQVKTAQTVMGACCRVIDNWNGVSSAFLECAHK